MKDLTKKLIQEHNVPLEHIKILEDMDKILFFKEYDEGFLSFIEGEEYDLLFSAAVNDNYSYRLWKDLLSYLDNSTRNIYMSFGNNQDRLLKTVESRFKDRYKIINKNEIIIIKESK